MSFWDEDCCNECDRPLASCPHCYEPDFCPECLYCKNCEYPENEVDDDWEIEEFGFLAEEEEDSVYDPNC